MLGYYVKKLHGQSSGVACLIEDEVTLWPLNAMPLVISKDSLISDGELGSNGESKVILQKSDRNAEMNFFSRERSPANRVSRQRPRNAHLS